MLTPQEEETQRAYDVLAETRNEGYGSFIWERQLSLFERFVVRRGRVLDLGCGNGCAAPAIARSFEYVGLDLNENMLETARTFVPGTSFVHGSMYRLAFPDGHFDGCWAVDSLIHVPKARIGTVLQEIRRVTKLFTFIAVREGYGEVMVSVPGTEHRRLLSYWQLEEFRAALHRVGMAIVHEKRGHRHTIRGRRYITCITYAPE